MVKPTVQVPVLQQDHTAAESTQTVPSSLQPRQRTAPEHSSVVSRTIEYGGVRAPLPSVSWMDVA
jgi:hypothetical protein